MGRTLAFLDMASTSTYQKGAKMQRDGRQGDRTTATTLAFCLCHDCPSSSSCAVEVSLYHLMSTCDSPRSFIAC